MDVGLCKLSTWASKELREQLRSAKAPNTLRDDPLVTGDSTEQKKDNSQGYDCTEGGKENITDTSSSERVNQIDFWFTPCSGRFGRSGTNGNPAIRAYIAIDHDSDEPYRYERLLTAEHLLVFSLVAFHTLQHTQSI